MPKILTLREEIILDDNLDLLFEYIRDDLLPECEMLDINDPETSTKDFILQEFELLQSHARKANSIKVIMALENIINSFDSTMFEFEDVLKIDYEAIPKTIARIIDNTKEAFKFPLKKLPNMEQSIVAELEKIYEETSLDKNLVTVGLLRNAIEQKNTIEVEKLALHLKKSLLDTQYQTKDSYQIEAYEGHLFMMFLDVFGKDDLEGFKMLFDNNEFYNLFLKEELELLNRSIMDDASKICKYIIEKQTNVYQKYNAVKIGKLIVETGSLMGLRSVFNEEECNSIYERYNLEQFTKNGQIFWEEEGKKDLQCANSKAIHLQIIAKEGSLKSEQGWKYDEFKINKQVCNVTELAKFAAMQDSPKCLEYLLKDERYDSETMPTSYLVSYAASENSLKTLSLLLKNLKADLNSCSSSRMPDIILVAELAIKNHADKALEVILENIDFTLSWNAIEDEGPILFDLLNIAIEEKSMQCHQMLLDREDYKFEGQYADIFSGYLKERKDAFSKEKIDEKFKTTSSDEDSGCEKSFPGSPDSCSVSKDFMFPNASKISSGVNLDEAIEISGANGAFHSYNVGEVY